MVEIFVPQSFVYKELVYLKNMGDENKREKAARAISIVMMIDSIVTAIIHFIGLYFCFEEYKLTH
ncbi:hypothetical protein OESDEN_18848 [Oesophagostomum dentatum]|uniref:Uncharacterized protein n=1 Tax=Oesophagostomum dentatum TaxID=61180 RepID=A0A0B1SC51_OESDE|nr:hypothetical protein OESDEN_18848 [Oesophagostomum dentatum]